MKLSDMLKDLKIDGKAVTVDDIDDLKEYRAKVKTFEDAQKAWEKERADANTTQAALSERLVQFENAYNELRASSGARTETTKLDESWAEDPIFKPLVPHVRHLNGQQGLILQALGNMVRVYMEDRKSISTMLDRNEVARLKGVYKDFDEEKVREAAKKHNLNDWEGAYKLWRADTETDRITEVKTQTEKETREKTLKELEDKGKPPPVTEMGAGSPGAGPAPGAGTEKKSYDQAWGGLVDELKNLGM